MSYLAANFEGVSGNSDAAPLSLLIVDDDSVFGHRLGKAFSDRGFDVEVCETVDHALGLVGKRHLDIVITDLRIGEKSGLTVIEAVNTLSKNTKTLVLTGYGNIHSAVVAVKLGATEYLSKPADADEILEVLGFVDKSASEPNTALKPPDLVRWEHIVSIFEATGGNMSESARLLNMHRRTLQRMLARGGPGPTD
ncbi:MULTISPECIES: response regulator [Rhizobium]|uniref:Response regulator n=1 Tax=Rhizobium rhododendri TaxID=2506430 RepID=A0ABY8ISI4_9HYPH|nr:MULTISPECIES: response regulator [Rhizobium]MBZ5759458.1 response regulator [Rhizobium sp. VS19-DR96]MBZ5765809.1 response regulator [Rhizobium sp. VS19-DR129.2]MBZ5773893.1 response regulator [Rhizobium sp. VS19-DRK62.2]MBZ5784965.1 response regulator [Rhizobium sp. VS19-DR121]MBZ5801958.1 response regulator [Rhizobium sp. VS19-DR181]